MSQSALTCELTVPGRDPESFYFCRQRWEAMSPLWRTVLNFNNTLLGRLSIGPLLAVVTLARAELPRLSLIAVVEEQTGTALPSTRLKDSTSHRTRR